MKDLVPDDALHLKSLDASRAFLAEVNRLSDELGLKSQSSRYDRIVRVCSAVQMIASVLAEDGMHPLDFVEAVGLALGIAVESSGTPPPLALRVMGESVAEGVSRSARAAR